MPALFPRIAVQITAPEVSLGSYDGKALARMPIAEACRTAKESGSALIEVHPNHEPPSCRLVPPWMVERVKHYFRGPAESLRSDRRSMGQAYDEFDEAGWNSRSVYTFEDRYYSSRGLQPMEHHLVLDAPVLGDQPLLAGNCELPDVVQITPHQFEAVWRIANAA